MGDKASTTAASAPFDNESADVILRTSDKVDFRVHKLVLSLASPFFEDMFSIPQPFTSSGVVALISPAEKAPVIDVAEDSATLDYLLRCVYPVDDPSSDSLDLLDRALAASLKYDINVATTGATTQLRSLIPQHSFQVFTVACRHDCGVLAQDAAVGCRKLSQQEKHQTADDFRNTLAGRTYKEEMGEAISAGCYFRLMSYMRTGIFATFCNPTVHPSHDTDGIRSEQPPFNRADADLTIESSDGQQFRVHRLLIDLNIDTQAAAPLDRVFGNSSGVPDASAVVRMTDDGDTLAELLGLLYPSPAGHAIAEWDISRFAKSTSQRVIRAAQRYGFTFVVRAYQMRLRQLLREAPLRIYCITAIFDWTEDMAAAAKRLAFMEIETMQCPEMDDLPAHHYHRLLVYHHRCQQALRGVIANCFPPRYGTPTQWAQRLSIANAPDSSESFKILWPVIVEYQADHNGYCGGSTDWALAQRAQLATLQVESALLAVSAPRNLFIHDCSSEYALGRSNFPRAHCETGSFVHCYRYSSMYI